MALENIKNVVFVMSNKGGVGKTTIAVNLAYMLADKKFKVGLIDLDIHGPNAAKMIGISKKDISISDNKKMIPVKINDNLKLISTAFMTAEDNAIIWRGPLKHNLIKQFLYDTEWGNLDYLVIDFPPGTGDEYISTAQFFKNSCNALIVSTPQEVSIMDSTRSINFCKELNIPIIGLIENMSGSLFGKDTIKLIAKKNNVNFIGALSLNSDIVNACNNGRPFVLSDSKPKKEFETIVDNILDYFNNNK